MLRHTALFMYQDTATEPQKLVALKGLAYLAYGCPTVQAVDFGRDLLGGTAPLAETKPWKRTPLWHARKSGPPCNFDMALNLDFDDQAGLDAYNDDDVHHEVGEYNISVGRGEFTARADWWYDGPPRIERGGARHISLFLWDDGVSDAQKSEARAALASLNDLPAVRSALTADNVGTLTTDYDLILDVMLADVDGAKAFLDHAGYQEAINVAAGVTKYEWTARITHTMGLG